MWAQNLLRSMDVLMRRLHRLSNLRFIPCGDKVSRVLIHLLSLIFCRQESWLHTWLIPTTVMSAWEQVPLLKLSATGDSLVLRCTMLYLWLLIQQCNGCPISPMYCWPHLPHLIKYITLEDLQEALTVTLNHSPVVWLKNSSIASSIRQVLHLATPHGWLPGSLQEADASEARTRRSLKFLGRWKEISGGILEIPSVVALRYEG